MTLVVWYSDADDADDADDDEDADDDDDDDDEGADDEPFWDVTAAEAIPFAATWLTCQSVTWGIKAQSRGGLAWWDGGYEGHVTWWERGRGVKRRTTPSHSWVEWGSRSEDAGVSINFKTISAATCMCEFE